MVYEWGFEEPSESVDLERIYQELRTSGQPAIAQYVYMEQLKKHAPIVWGRLRDWAQARKVMNWVEWNPQPTDSARSSTDS